MPELVVRDEQNRPESVQYMELIPLLLQQWKAQQAEIMRERRLNARQEAVIDAQAEKIAALEWRLAALEAAHTRSPRREAAMWLAKQR